MERVYDLALVNGKVYLGAEVGFQEVSVYVLGGKIAAVTQDRLQALETIDCKGLKLLPGLIDPHVHFALDLGNIKSCDDFYSGTRAAAFGGITTVLDFLDPISSTSELQGAFDKRVALAMEQKPMVDIGFHSTLGNFQGDVSQLVKMVKQLGLFGVKVFTTYAESNRKIDEAILEALLDQPVLTLVHAEKNGLIKNDWHDISTYQDSRPLSSELEMLDWLKAHLGKGRLYVVHVSSGSGVLALANQESIFIETGPHYALLDASIFSAPDGGKYLMAPPLRPKEEQLKLQANMSSVHTIGTDHCPFMLAQKLGTHDASLIPKGIGGISYSFLRMYQAFGEAVIDKMSRNVATIFGLTSKGSIEVGRDADFALFDENGVTHGSQDPTNCDYNAFDRISEDGKLKGAIVGTMLRGKWVLYQGVWGTQEGRVAERTK